MIRIECVCGVWYATRSGTDVYLRGRLNEGADSVLAAAWRYWGPGVPALITPRVGA